MPTSGYEVAMNGIAGDGKTPRKDSTIQAMDVPITIPCSVPGKAYKILLSTGCLGHLGVLMTSDSIQPRLKVPTKALVVSNPVVFKLYGRETVAGLREAGFVTSVHLVEDGERFKTLQTVHEIYDTCLENRLDRTSCVVALGGGVVGDMAGYVAATWLRGIPVIQVPTSLLAMVDSSIGGKTGVNHPRGKNLIGAFHQPSMVLIDPQVLQTLSYREFKAAMGEVIKCGVILDKELFLHLEERKSTLDDHKSWRSLETILHRTCKAKADVVSKDEKESGKRALLNYGHTVGHALESLLNYEGLLHGEAVAIGMIVAGKIAVDLGYWSQEDFERQNRLINCARLPNQIPPHLKIGDIMEALRLDKKVKHGKVHFTLPLAIGQGFVTDSPSVELIERVLYDCRQRPSFALLPPTEPGNQPNFYSKVENT